MTTITAARHRSRAPQEKPEEPAPSAQSVPSRIKYKSEGIHDLQVTWRSIDELKPAARNARTHSKKQIEQISASIRRFGFNNPILIDADNAIIAGHGRLLAAERLGWKQVPTVRLDHLSDAEKRAYILADNKLAEKAGWDLDLLRLELQGLLEIDEFEIEITGFDTVEIDRLIEAPYLAEEGTEDAVPALKENEPPVSRPGDLWLLGRHRVLCGNALDAAAYDRLMEGQKAQMVITDPPFNVKVDGHVCGTGRIKHRPFLMASGEMSAPEFEAFLTTAFRHMATNSEDGAIAFAFMDWRHMSEVIAAGKSAFTELKNLIVWAKDNAGMGSFYRSQHELIFAFKNGTAPTINNFLLGETGRYRTNVWQYPGANTFRRGRLEDLADHPTVKPVALIADAIRDCSRRKGIILDPFLGSGTTILAAERTGRVARGMELDPRYVDVILRRWTASGGAPPQHAESGGTFDDVAEERDAPADLPAASADREADYG